MQIDINEQQAQLVDQYASVDAQIKELTAQLKGLRSELDSIVVSAEVPDHESAVLRTENSMLEYSSPSESLRFSANMVDFVNETKCFDVLDISITKARKQLTAENLARYFTTVIGSRKLYVM